MKRRGGILGAVLTLAGASAFAGSLVATDLGALFAANAAPRIPGLDRVRDITAGTPGIQLVQAQLSDVQDVQGGDPATALNPVPVLPVPEPPSVTPPVSQGQAPKPNDGAGSALLALAVRQTALDFIATSLPPGVTVQTATPEQLADALSSCGPNADVISVLLQVRGDVTVIQAVVARAVEASTTLAPTIVGAIASLGAGQAVIATSVAVQTLATLGGPQAAGLIGQVVQQAVAANKGAAVAIAGAAAQAAPGLAAPIVAAAVLGNPASATQLATLVVPTAGPAVGQQAVGLNPDGRQLVQSQTFTDTQTAALVNVTPSEAQISTTRAQ